jgi:hypothetical protein
MKQYHFGLLKTRWLVVAQCIILLLGIGLSFLGAILWAYNTPLAIVNTFIGGVAVGLSGTALWLIATRVLRGSD